MLMSVGSGFGVVVHVEQMGCQSRDTVSSSFFCSRLTSHGMQAAIHGRATQFYCASILFNVLSINSFSVSFFESS